jgi:hypothetical protein
MSKFKQAPTDDFKLVRSLSLSFMLKTGPTYPIHANPANRSCDITGCTTLDRPPFFPLPVGAAVSYPILAPGSQLSRTITHLTCAYNIAFSSHMAIMSILISLAAFTLHLQLQLLRRGNEVYSDYLTSGFFINPLLHQLLNLRRSTSSIISPPSPSGADAKPNYGSKSADNIETDISLYSHSTATQEILRLTSILYLSPLRRRFGYFPVLSGVQLRKLHDLLSSTSSSSCHSWPISSLFKWDDTGLLELWVISIALIETNDCREPEGRVLREWFWKELDEAIRRRRWEENMKWARLENTLEKFLWIGDVHGRLLEEIVAREMGGGGGRLGDR